MSARQVQWQESYRSGVIRSGLRATMIPLLVGMIFYGISCGPTEKSSPGAKKIETTEREEIQPNRVNYQTTSPISGKPVKRNVNTDYKGKRIYFCCPTDMSIFKQAPEKYMKVFREQGIILEDAPSGK